MPSLQHLLLAAMPLLAAACYPGAYRCSQYEESIVVCNDSKKWVRAARCEYPTANCTMVGDVPYCVAAGSAP